MRRQALNRFFSKAAVSRLEPTIYRVISKFCEKIESYAGSGIPVTLSSAFICMTTVRAALRLRKWFSKNITNFLKDIVTEYSFGWSYHFMDSPLPTFQPNFASETDAAMELNHFMKQFSWLYRVLRVLPE